MHYAAAMAAGLHQPVYRDQLLSGMDPAAVGSIPRNDVPSLQLHADLNWSNSPLADGSLPLVRWLENAVKFTAATLHQVKFRRLLERVEALSATTTPKHGHPTRGREVSEGLPASIETRRRGALVWIAPLLLAAGAGAGFLVTHPPQLTRATRTMPKWEPGPNRSRPPLSRPPDAPVPKEPVPSREPASSMVSLRSNPSGATATRAGYSEACTTPCSMELPTGRHLIRFDLVGHRTNTAYVEVPGESSALANLEQRMGTLEVRTNPPGAQILVDGRLHSEVTPATFLLAAGKHRITVRLAQVPDEEQEIDLMDRAVAELAVSWAH